MTFTVTVFFLHRQRIYAISTRTLYLWPMRRRHSIKSLHHLIACRRPFGNKVNFCVSGGRTRRGGG